VEVAYGCRETVVGSILVGLDFGRFRLLGIPLNGFDLGAFWGWNFGAAVSTAKKTFFFDCFGF
jgi:hypothetical protein